MKEFYQHKAIVVDLLCKAFDTNKSVNYSIKQDSRRIQRIKKLMEYSVDVCSLFGKIYLSSDKKACALTLFPDKKKTSLQTLLWDIQFVWQVTGLSRIKAVLNREALIKKGYPASQPFLYLWFIGVDPDYQGTGKGSTLLSQIIEDANHVNKPIYLETSSPDNVRFYQKFGFEVYNQLQFGYTLYAMRKSR